MEYDPKLRKRTRQTKAYNNNTFLNSRDARNIRVQCEMQEPGERLKQLGIKHMISFFGSARTKPDHPDYINAYDIAYKLGQRIGGPDIGINSGGGPGIMEAVNKGAKESGCISSIGMGISLPFEQRNNDYISKDLEFQFHYFFTRKYWCVYLSKAFVVMPGGVGTMDELFEILTLIQTEKIPGPKPIVLFNSEFWNRVINFQVMVDHGTISPEDVDLFKITDNVTEAVDHIINNIDLTQKYT